MTLIWFNPDANLFQKGPMNEYEIVAALSDNPDKFELIYQFSDTSNCIIDKVVSILNTKKKNLSSTAAQ